MFPIVLLFLYMVLPARAACPYGLKDLKIETCDGKPVSHWTMSGIDAEFTSDCNILIKGCNTIHVEITDIKVDYKAYKNDAEIHKGNKAVCGMTIFGQKIECPIPKDKKICATDKWIAKVPKALLPMAVGKIRGEAKVKTNAGEVCYSMTTEIIKK